MQQLRRRRTVLATEDCITAHRKIDLAHLKSNLRNSGLLPEVRAGLDRRLGGGWVTASARIFRAAKPVTAPIGRDCYNAVAFQPSNGAGSDVPDPDRRELTHQRAKPEAQRAAQSVGNEIGEQAFAAWLTSQPAAAAKADANAALIVDMLWPLVQQGALAIPRGGYLLRRGRGRIVVEPAQP